MTSAALIATRDRIIAAARLLPPLAVAGLLAASCATAPAPDATVQSSDETGRVLTVGYESISERYVDSVVIGNVALAGLHGLSTIDPDLDVLREGDKVELVQGGAVKASLQAPDDHDPDAWAALTANAFTLARGMSAKISQASADIELDAVFGRALPTLDEFSRYAGLETARMHRASREGFGGIGFEFTPAEQGALQVTAIIPDTPAAKGGLKVGDKIMEVDGATVAGLDPAGIARLLRGRVNTSVTLIVRRDGETGPLRLTFERDLIVPTTVTAKRDGDIGYLHVSGFNQRTAISVSQAFFDLKAQGPLKGLVLDVRNNPGGLLDQAVAVADLFLKDGEIISTRGRHPDSSQQFDASGQDISDGLPIAVLINGESASAAEIVAAALQDRGRAILVGSNSFGKGTVQNVIRLPNDGELTITWSRIFSPSGFAFHHLGLMPNVCTNKASATADSLVNDLRAGRIDPATTLNRWRSLSTSTVASPAEVRATCPPRHDMSETDVAVARSLLEDKDLFARAVRPPYPTVATR
ncbi:MAG: S41 family peptidase [Alphaproteobacteria bacterium]